MSSMTPIFKLGSKGLQSAGSARTLSFMRTAPVIQSPLTRYDSNTSLLSHLTAASTAASRIIGARYFADKPNDPCTVTQAAESTVRNADNIRGESCVTHFQGKKNAGANAVAIAKSGGTKDERGNPISADEWTANNPIWTQAELDSIEITHKPPKNMQDRLAFYMVKTMRIGFDTITGYHIHRSSRGSFDEKKCLTRIIFLETVAGVPPMMACMVRHLQSLRLMRRDSGWIHTLFEEAENERMHLMIALSLRNPGTFFRLAVMTTQAGFCFFYFLLYIVAPRVCHRFVGYLEEEAVKTYTSILVDLDAGLLPMFSRMRAPSIAREYYHLPDNAEFRQVLANIRADEAHHRDVNHVFADIQETDINPFKLDKREGK